MSPKALMITGAIGSLTLIFIASIFKPDFVHFALFGFGALFGKGYGIWEERCRRAALDAMEEGK